MKGVRMANNDYRKRLGEAFERRLGDTMSGPENDAQILDKEIGYSAVCEALNKVVKLYARIRPMCRRADHKPLRFPSCLDCRFDARMEESDDALSIARGEKGVRL